MIIEKFGIHGIPLEIEYGIWAGMALGDPLLLVGKHGTAKTALINLIGAALRNKTRRKFPNDPTKWFEYQIYDASKINFEDLIGLPNPEALRKGRTEFIASPLTVWNKRLVGFDEFSRQLPERQNNIFELIRSRRLMGMPTKVVWIINAMNPMSYTATEELDEALIDRHLFFLEFPSFDSMDSEARLSIVEYIGTDDAPAMRLLTNKHTELTSGNTVNNKLADIGEQISLLLKQGAQEFVALEEKFGFIAKRAIERTCALLDAVADLHGISISLSGRRAGMLYRGFLSLLAINKVCADNGWLDQSGFTMSHLYRLTLKLGIPIGIAPSLMKDPEKLLSIIMSTAEGVNLDNGEDKLKGMMTAYDIMLEQDPLRTLSLAIENKDVLDEPQKSGIINYLLKKLENKEDDDKQTDAMSALLNLLYPLYRKSRFNYAIQGRAGIANHLSRDEVADIITGAQMKTMEEAGLLNVPELPVLVAYRVGKLVKKHGKYKAKLIWAMDFEKTVKEINTASVLFTKDLEHLTEE